MICSRSDSLNVIVTEGVDPSEFVIHPVTLIVDVADVITMDVVVRLPKTVVVEIPPGTTNVSSVTEDVESHMPFQQMKLAPGEGGGHVKGFGGMEDAGGNAEIAHELGYASGHIDALPLRVHVVRVMEAKDQPARLEAQ